MAEERMLITGGQRLEGTVRVSGGKNTSVAVISASILSETPCVIENLPNIEDVNVSVETLRHLGAKVNWDPDMGVMEAINMSKAQTAGFKWQLFVLDLSFIGWRILSGLTLNILAIWLNPYIVQTDVGFFQQIKAAKGIGWSPDRGGSGEFRPYDGPDHTDNTRW